MRDWLSNPLPLAKMAELFVRGMNAGFLFKAFIPFLFFVVLELPKRACYSKGAVCT
jgi:hypothetical protein